MDVATNDDEGTTSVLVHGPDSTKQAKCMQTNETVASCLLLPTMASPLLCQCVLDSMKAVDGTN